LAFLLHAHRKFTTIAVVVVIIIIIIIIIISAAAASAIASVAYPPVMTVCLGLVGQVHLSFRDVSVKFD
jgi:hypothetical protein